MIIDYECVGLLRHRVDDQRGAHRRTSLFKDETINQFSAAPACQDQTILLDIERHRTHSPREYAVHAYRLPIAAFTILVSAGCEDMTQARIMDSSTVACATLLGVFGNRGATHSAKVFGHV